MNDSVRPGAWGLAALATATVLTATPVHAAFHLMVIEELMSGYSGDPDVQYVELRMTAGGQNVVNNSKLTAFNADGSAFTVLITTPSNVANGASGSRILYGTTEFALAAGVAPDFTIPSGILTPSGMVCWGKPGVNEGNPDSYIDCVAYGNYTGPTSTHSGTPTFRPPGDDLNTLGRISDTEDNLSDFFLLAPSPRNNAGTDGNLGGGGPTSTTTTTTTSTTTTTLTPVCDVAPELPGNCRLGTAGKSQLLYKDGDPGVASKKDKLKWKASKLLDAVTAADFDDPVNGSASYRVCVYDNGTQIAEMDVPPGGLCAGKPCWKALGTKGFKFKDRDALPHGIDGLLLKEGDAGKGKVLAKGKGVNLPMPGLPLTGPVVVQLLIDDGIETECFQTEFTGPFLKNEASLFKAKGP